MTSSLLPFKYSRVTLASKILSSFLSSLRLFTFPSLRFSPFPTWHILFHTESTCLPSHFTIISPRTQHTRCSRTDQPSRTRCARRPRAVQTHATASRILRLHKIHIFVMFSILISFYSFILSFQPHPPFGPRDDQIPDLQRNKKFCDTIHAQHQTTSLDWSCLSIQRLLEGLQQIQSCETITYTTGTLT